MRNERQHDRGEHRQGSRSVHHAEIEEAEHGRGRRSEQIHLLAADTVGDMTRQGDGEERFSGWRIIKTCPSCRLAHPPNGLSPPPGLGPFLLGQTHGWTKPAHREPTSETGPGEVTPGRLAKTGTAPPLRGRSVVLV